MYMNMHSLFNITRRYPDPFSVLYNRFSLDVYKRQAYQCAVYPNAVPALTSSYHNSSAAKFRECLPDIEDSVAALHLHLIFLYASIPLP